MFIVRLYRNDAKLNLMTAVLMRPLVAVEDHTPAVLITLPAGAMLDFEPFASADTVDVECDGKIYRVNPQDLLNAISAEAAARAAWQ